MPTSARNYAYRVIIQSDEQKPEPTISLKTLRQYQNDVAKYLRNEKDKPDTNDKIFD